MQEIALTKGFIALVDDDDYESLVRHKWHASVCTRGGRRLAEARRFDGEKNVSMHRVVMNATAGVIVDHRRHRPLSAKTIDNRKENLRFANGSQNQANARKIANATSIFKGVRWYRRKKKWAAALQINKRRICLGYFLVEAHAALAYDLAAVREFGEFALTNFPIPGSNGWIFQQEEP